MSDPDSTSALPHTTSDQTAVTIPPPNQDNNNNNGEAEEETMVNNNVNKGRGGGRGGHMEAKKAHKITNEEVVAKKEEKMKKLNVNLQDLVHVDEVVKEYLIELRSVRLCEGWTLTPRAIFNITLILFFLPSLWSVCSVLISQDLPDRVFFDKCRNGTGDPTYEVLNNLKSVEYPYEDCIACSGNSPYVYTNSSAISFTSQAGFALIVVLFNVLLTFIATIFFVRLSIKEFTAIHFLGYDVLVQVGFDCTAIFGIVLVTILSMVAAAINVGYSYLIRMKLDNIPLGYKTESNATVGTCFGGTITEGLFAVFDDDNPSINSALSPNDPISIIAAVFAAFLLYVPLVVRLAGLATSTFNSFKVKDLMTNSRVTAKIFSELAYTVDYDDLMESIKDYSETQDPEDCGCAAIVTRLFSLHCLCDDPPPDFFGYTWGFDVEDMNFVVSLLLERGQLREFSPEEFDAELNNLKERNAAAEGKPKKIEDNNGKKNGDAGGFDNLDNNGEDDDDIEEREHVSMKNRPKQEKHQNPLEGSGSNQS